MDGVRYVKRLVRWINMCTASTISMFCSVVQASLPNDKSWQFKWLSDLHVKNKGWQSEKEGLCVFVLLCFCVYVYMQCVRLCVCASAGRYVCMCVCVHVRRCVRMCVYASLCLIECVSVYQSVCLWVCKFVRLGVYLRTIIAVFPFLLKKVRLEKYVHKTNADSREIGY